MEIKQGIVIPCLGHRRQLVKPIKTTGNDRCVAIATGPGNHDRFYIDARIVS